MKGQGFFSGEEETAPFTLKGQTGDEICKVGPSEMVGLPLQQQ